MKKSSLPHSLIVLSFFAFFISFFAGCKLHSQSGAPTPKPSPAQEQISASYQLYISEVMVHNRATLLCDGAFPEWVELYNGGSVPVPLSAFSLVKGDEGQTLPDLTLEPGAYVVLCCGEAADKLAFSLSEDDRLTLCCGFTDVRSVCDFAPLGSTEDISLVRSEDGSYVLSERPTPGFANDEEGYEQYMRSLVSLDPLRINEVFAHGSSKQGTRDWIELYNAGTETISLSDYSLSDRDDRPGKLFPGEGELAPGAYYICQLGEESFSLSEEETLYLFRNKVPVDLVKVAGIPTCGSIGREEDGGWYYYPAPSEGEENKDGFRSVTGSVALDGKDGVFSPGETVTVSLSGEGVIYYTLDCSRPDTESIRYTEPFAVSANTVVRAFSVSEGKLPSEPVAFSFIFEDRALPVVSVVGDDPAALERLKYAPEKEPEIPAYFSLYENGSSVTAPCGIRIAGNSSTRLFSKSYKIFFRSCFGQDELHYDVFGSGMDSYHSLGLRRGYDSSSLVFRNEIVETLAREADIRCPVQNSKFCRMYINGSYWGLVSLRDDYSSSYFANNYGGDKEDVEYIKFPLERNDDFYREVITFCNQNTGRYLSDEGLDTFCAMVDIDAFIDWLIIKGYFGDVDHFPNVGCFRSPATAYRWTFILWDFDWAFTYPFRNLATPAMESYESPQLITILKTLLTNEKFREMFLARLAELLEGPLSDENVLAVIDGYTESLRDDIALDLEHWRWNYAAWELRVSSVRQLFADGTWRKYTIDGLCSLPYMEREEVLSALGEA